nr:MAG TPA: hypothetical protein [Caudoviricetes sp.]
MFYLNGILKIQQQNIRAVCLRFGFVVVLFTLIRELKRLKYSKNLKLFEKFFAACFARVFVVGFVLFRI